MTEGRGWKVKVESPRCGSAKADTFDVGGQCIQSSAKRLNFPVVGRSFELWRWKNLAKNLEMTTTTINGPRGEFNLIFCSAKSQRTHSFRFKFVVCLPTKVVWDLTELFLSTVWLSLPSLAAKNIYKECDINSVCELNKLDKPIFFDRQNQNGHIYEFVFRLEFDTSSVWQRD